jgi:hypothetical protein
LKLTNTGSFDKRLLNGEMSGKKRSSSFDLIVFKVNQVWDNGVGYDADYVPHTFGVSAISTRASNWYNPQTNITWANGAGIFSGSTSGATIATQHFDKGNENIDLDITAYVNGLITGDTNYGLAIAYNNSYESTQDDNIQYVGFFTNNTHTIYEPFVETIYSNTIKDDRNKFFLNKTNKLYLYVNLAGTPTNLDYLPTVDILDNYDAELLNIPSTSVTHVTKGVYSVDVLIGSSPSYIDSTMFSDVWSDLTINGLPLDPITLSFVLKDSSAYYSIGSNDSPQKGVGVTISGLKDKENIIRGDIRKVTVSARIPFTVEQPQCVNKISYRIYTHEGVNELTIIDFQEIEMANNSNYFLLDSLSLLPTTYYIDMLVESNLAVTRLSNVISFDIISQSNLRYSQ